MSFGKLPSGTPDITKETVSQSVSGRLYGILAVTHVDDYTRHRWIPETSRGRQVARYHWTGLPHASKPLFVSYPKGMRPHLSHCAPYFWHFLF